MKCGNIMKYEYLRFYKHMINDKQNKSGHINSNEFNIDERALYGTDTDKIHLIQLGKATNYYDEWRDHPNEYIRCALARRGYHSEYYLTDTINIRNAALYHLPEKNDKLCGR